MPISPLAICFPQNAIMGAHTQNVCRPLIKSRSLNQPVLFLQKLIDPLGVSDFTDYFTVYAEIPGFLLATLSSKSDSPPSAIKSGRSLAW